MKRRNFFKNLGIAGVIPFVPIKFFQKQKEETIEFNFGLPERWLFGLDVPETIDPFDCIFHINGNKYKAKYTYGKDGLIDGFEFKPEDRIF